MEWKIKPLIGAGDLKFGMTPNEVSNIIGSNIKFMRTIEDGSINEYREGGNTPVCNYNDGRLRCIDIYSMNYNAELDNMFVFQESPQVIIDYCESINGPPSVLFGICYFKSIGISLGKWIDSQTLIVKAKPERAKDLRSISISAKGTHFDIFTDAQIASLSKSSKI